MSVQRLANKVAVVTGAASGIGEAICHRFAKEGATIAMIDRNADKLRSTWSSIPSSNNKTEHCYFEGDVSSSHFTSEIFNHVQKTLGCHSDILVNCAGITRDAMLLDISEKKFDDVINVNLKSVHLLTQSYIKSLRHSGGIHPASIVNISSIIGKTGNIGQSNYAASKAGVIAFTKSVGYEFGRFNVRCNAVLPGFTVSPMTDVVPEKLKQKIIRMIPMKRMADPSEIASVCLFLASDESSYVNCAAIEVTGGLSA